MGAWPELLPGEESWSPWQWPLGWSHLLPGLNGAEHQPPCSGCLPSWWPCCLMAGWGLGVREGNSRGSLEPLEAWAQAKARKQQAVMNYQAGNGSKCQRAAWLVHQVGSLLNPCLIQEQQRQVLSWEMGQGQMPRATCPAARQWDPSCGHPETLSDDRLLHGSWISNHWAYCSQPRCSFTARVFYVAMGGFPQAFLTTSQQMVHFLLCSGQRFSTGNEFLLLRTTSNKYL